MKRHTHYISLLFLACLGMTACNEHDLDEMDSTQGMELTVSCAGHSTRAEAQQAGEDAYNENLISTLHYFLYTADADETAQAVLTGRIDLQAGTTGQTVVRIPMNETELNTVVFPRPNETCKVLLIANLPADVAITDNSRAGIRQLAVITDFQEQLPQPSFVMVGEGEAQIVSRNKAVAAKGNIDLKRLATKFTTRISVEEQYYDRTENTIWKPAVDQMEVYFEYAAKNTTLEGALGDQYFNYDARKRIGTKQVTWEIMDDEGVVTGTRDRTAHVFAPFYSYPRYWEYTQEDALMMFVMLPWANEKDGYTQYRSCWYKVYPNAQTLESNSWYNIDLHIGVLGSFTQKEIPITVEGLKYSVMNWNNENVDWATGLELETDLLGAHYLVVERNEYVINNRATFEIPFISSHECTIEDLKVTRMDFGTTANPKADPVDITDEAEGWLTLDGNTVKLNHELNNDFIGSTDYDFSPYTFEFTLCHKNNPNFSEVITITQKPAISITAHLNSYREAYLAGELPSGNNGTNGYQYVNGTAANSGGDGDYGGAYGLYINSSSSTNTNPYMYSIEVTVLPDGSDYILGDPRWETPATPSNTQGLDFGNFEEEAPGIESEGQAQRPDRTLQNYYGTKSDESVQNMIAPKFRIASSHGVTMTVTHTNAFNRAATYQEDGYPAGRWRVPTKAEVKFIIKLSADGKIPTLFNNGSAYWCANGTVTPNNNGISETTGTGGNNAVRCVYDDWYWENTQWPRMTSRGDHPNKYNQFTWGDEID